MQNTQDSLIYRQKTHRVSFSAQLLRVFGYTIIMALASQLEIPNYPVPYTTQTFFVLCAGILLGAQNGALAMLLYLTLGALGLPVFSGGSFGILKLFGPTGGYLLAFPIAAFIAGYVSAKRKEYWWMLVSMATALFTVFAAGTLQLQIIYLHNWSNALTAGFLIFSWWDTLKLVAAAAIGYSYYRTMK